MSFDNEGTDLKLMEVITEASGGRIRGHGRIRCSVYFWNHSRW